MAIEAISNSSRGRKIARAAAIVKLQGYATACAGISSVEVKLSEED